MVESGLMAQGPHLDKLRQGGEKNETLNKAFKY